jgi:PAS domain S-box-containing protein
MRFLFANPAAAELFHTSQEALIGRYVHEFLTKEGHERIKREIVLRKAGGKSTYELDLILPGGEQRRVMITATPQVNDEGEFYGSLAIFRDITERRQYEEKLRLQTTALEATANGILITDRTGIIVWVNPAYTTLTGYSAPEVIGRKPSILRSGVHDQSFYKEMWQTITSGKAWHGELVNRRKDGSHYFEEMTITPLVNASGKIDNFVAVKQDISHRKESEKELHLLDMQLRQSQKLEAVGQLASGIAHEINTPIQYVGDNTRFIKDAFGSLRKIVVNYQELLAAAKNGAFTPELAAKAEKALEDADIDYLFQQVPSAVNETLEGVERVTKIVRAMKEFSHPGGKEKTAADINCAIESTTTVARNEWKYVSDLKLDFDRDLPSVPCFLGEFNQAILNLVINASHAIADVVKRHPGTKGVIAVKTRRDGNFAEVRVSDTGTGIPEKNRPHIFEPFFTTKEVGKGTGQGLSLVYGSVVKNHGGTVTFETEEGKGTTFIIRLPLAASA